jgi:hypothetical protein
VLEQKIIKSQDIKIIFRKPTHSNHLFVVPLICQVIDGIGTNTWPLFRGTSRVFVQMRPDALRAFALHPSNILCVVEGPTDVAGSVVADQMPFRDGTNEVAIEIWRKGDREWEILRTSFKIRDPVTPDVVS